MRSPKSSPVHPSTSPDSKSRKTPEKLQSYRPVPYHIALNKAARLEAWTQDIETFGGPSEAIDSSDFDPRLMEREWSED